MKNLFGIGAICLALAVVAWTSVTGFAQDQKVPLAELPSKPGSHVEKIKALGDDEWRVATLLGSFVAYHVSVN